MRERSLPADGDGGSQGKCAGVVGDIGRISGIELVDQNPIGRSTRSNPATYIKAYDEIRQLYASQPLAKARGYKPGYFSFNTEGGRCEVCEGEGYVTVGMFAYHSGLTKYSARKQLNRWTEGENPKLLKTRRGKEDIYTEL